MRCFHEFFCQDSVKISKLYYHIMLLCGKTVKSFDKKSWKKILKKILVKTLNSWNINNLWIDEKFWQKYYFSYILDDPPPEATFRGTEYITYDLQQRSLEPILSINDELSLYFKTRKSSGLLFYTGKKKIFSIFSKDFFLIRQNETRKRKSMSIK